MESFQTQTINNLIYLQNTRAHQNESRQHNSVTDFSQTPAQVSPHSVCRTVRTRLERMSDSETNKLNFQLR